MIDILYKLLPSPENPKNSKGDWNLIENELSIILPNDYKLLIENYGDYNWNNFLWVFNPFSDDKNVNLITNSKEICKNEIQFKNQYSHYYPINIYPETNGIFPWAITDNGDHLFWIINEESNNWPTLIKGPRAPEFEVHFMKTHMLVYHIVKGSLNSMILPNEL